MKISKSLIPNCSEFTFYVNLSTSSKESIKRFKKMMKEIESAKNDSLSEDLIERDKAEKILGEYGASSISFGKDVILGVKCYLIQGDAGDHGYALGEKLNETGVIYESKGGI
jgi:hypothetical protein